MIKFLLIIPSIDEFSEGIWIMMQDFICFVCYPLLWTPKWLYRIGLKENLVCGGNNYQKNYDNDINRFCNELWDSISDKQNFVLFLDHLAQPYSQNMDLYLQQLWAEITGQHRQTLKPCVHHTGSKSIHYTFRIGYARFVHCTCLDLVRFWVWTGPTFKPLCFSVCYKKCYR